MATIEARGPNQFRAKVRLRGQTASETFATRREAEEWARIQEGRILGEEYVDPRIARRTSLADALDWYRDHGIDRGKADAKNKIAKIRYWRESEFAGWSIVSVHAQDLIDWRRRILDEDNAEDGEAVGPEAEVSAQTVVHRLNVLSQVYKTWGIAHRVKLDNPVGDTVRPSVNNNRDRRLSADEEERLFAAARRSSRPWFKAAIDIALETGLRQAEEARLTWGQVHMDEPDPYIFLPKTKNGRPREVPLSTRAIAAFRSLLPKNGAGVTGCLAVFPVETPRAFGHAFRDAVPDREFPNLRWHDLRHEAISRLFERTNFRDHEIMTIAGHKDGAMLYRYAHLRTRRLAKHLG